MTLATGSRREVWNGEAVKTSGGLRKKHLIKRKDGRIVSKRKSEMAKARLNANPALKAKFEANKKRKR